MEHLLFRNESCTCKPVIHCDTTRSCSDFQGWGFMLAPDFSVLFLQVVERHAATFLPLGKPRDNLALAPLPLTVLLVVMQVAMISSKQRVMLLPRDLSVMLYKQIALYYCILEPKIPEEREQRVKTHRT